MNQYTPSLQKQPSELQLTLSQIGDSKEKQSLRFSAVYNQLTLILSIFLPGFFTFTFNLDNKLAIPQECAHTTNIYSRTDPVINNTPVKRTSTNSYEYDYKSCTSHIRNFSIVANTLLVMILQIKGTYAGIWRHQGSNLGAKL